MATLLRRLRLKRVSLVDTPANEDARVVLFKAQPTDSEVNVDGMVECKKCGASVAKGSAKCSKCGAPMSVSKAGDRPEEDKMDEAKLKADLDAANAKLADATAQIAALTTERESLTKERDALQKAADTPEAIEKRKLEALPESIRKELETSRADIKKLKDERAEGEMVAFVTKSASALPGNHEDNGKLLKRVQDAVVAEDFTSLVTMLKAASAQIEKGGLFKEVGRDGAGDPAATSPMARIDQLVAEKITKKADLKKSDALDQVLQEHPELYDAYSRSVMVGANADAD